MHQAAAGASNTTVEQQAAVADGGAEAGKHIYLQAVDR